MYIFIYKMNNILRCKKDENVHRFALSTKRGTFGERKRERDREMKEREKEGKERGKRKRGERERKKEREKEREKERDRKERETKKCDRKGGQEKSLISRDLKNANLKSILIRYNIS